MDERQRLRAIRGALKLGLFVSAGFLSYFNESHNVDTFGGLHAGVGFMLRKNFAYRVGVHLRAGFWGGPASGRASETYEDISGGVIRVATDVAIRIGPFAQKFPLYFDVGAFLGLGWLQGTPADDGDDGGGNNTSWVGFTAGPDYGFGFVAGSNEQFDIGVRGRIGLVSGFSMWGTSGYFSVSFL